MKNRKYIEEKGLWLAIAYTPEGEIAAILKNHPELKDNFNKALSSKGIESINERIKTIKFSENRTKIAYNKLMLLWEGCKLKVESEMIDDGYHFYGDDPLPNDF